jgi:hypothetical protein
VGEAAFPVQKSVCSFSNVLAEINVQPIVSSEKPPAGVGVIQKGHL